MSLGNILIRNHTENIECKYNLLNNSKENNTNKGYCSYLELIILHKEINWKKLGLKEIFITNYNIYIILWNLK